MILVRRVLHHILTILRYGQLPNAMCYDCACTLKLFINRHFGSNDLQSTEFTGFLESLTMVLEERKRVVELRSCDPFIFSSPSLLHVAVYIRSETKTRRERVSERAR